MFLHIEKNALAIGVRVLLELTIKKRSLLKSTFSTRLIRMLPLIKPSSHKLLLIIEIPNPRLISLS